ncbi:MAG: TatD family hydrolase [Candidatus Aenigmatarchaeota archaeon]
MIDAHCHLSFPDFDNKRDRIVEESKKTMTAIIDSAPSIENSEKSLALARKYPGFVFSCLGLHPEDIINLDEKQIDDYANFVRSNRDNIVAVGEVGIDNFHVKMDADRKKCRDVFAVFIELAKEIRKPLVIHAREDNGEAAKILEEQGAKDVILHCFGSPQLVDTVVVNKWFVSIPTLIVRSKKHVRLAKEVPIELILTETDSPFLSPSHGETNIPQNVKYVIESIASARGVEFDEVDRITTENAIKAFNLPIRPKTV